MEPLDGQWGMFVDGAYTGLIGQLQRKVGLQCLIRKNINFTKNAFKKHCGSTSRINMFYCKALGQVINKSSVTHAFITDHATSCRIMVSSCCTATSCGA